MKSKIIRLLAAVLAAVMLPTGCLESEYGIAADRMDTAVEKGDMNAVTGIAEEYLSEHPKDKAFLCRAAVCCDKAGDSGAAEMYYLRCLDIDPSHEKAVSGYITMLWKTGRLERLSDSFPEKEEFIFRGKPLSEYDSRDLIEMTSSPNQISYRKEEYIYDTVSFGQGGEDDDPVMPYGIERSMSNMDIYEAVGFTHEQAERISGVKYLFIDMSGGEFRVEAKDSRYEAFSQHPYEDWELRVKKDSMLLVFNSTDEMTSYTAGVLV